MVVATADGRAEPGARNDNGRARRQFGNSFFSIVIYFQQ
jgi:hypothetical protein